MKKIINQPENIIDDMLEGFLYAFGSDFYKDETENVIYKKSQEDKVQIIIGGGSGHEPLFLGFVGQGLADGAVIGNVFTAPPPQAILEASKELDTGKGVLYVYGNYSGDFLNFDMGAELADLDDIQNKTVAVCDDVASAPRSNKHDRRGIAGDIFVIKIAGAASEKGYELNKVAELAEKANENVFSIGVALSPGTIPGANQKTFELPEDEIEFGMGIHGEPGVERTKMKNAEDLTNKMLEKLFSEADLEENEEVCVLVNGLGSTTLLELMIINKHIHKAFEEKNIKIYDSDVNSYCTTQEMAGASISVLKLDDELKDLYNQRASSPYYYKKGRS